MSTSFAQSASPNHRLYVCPRCSEHTLQFVNVPRAEWLRHKYREDADFRERHLQAKRKERERPKEGPPPRRTAAAK